LDTLAGKIKVAEWTAWLMPQQNLRSTNSHEITPANFVLILARVNSCDFVDRSLSLLKKQEMQGAFHEYKENDRRLMLFSCIRGAYMTGDSR
jgi:hypothetical protein